MWKVFQEKAEKNGTLAKKAPKFFGPPGKISNFHKYFRKSKTHAYERFSHYCDSSVEFLKLSALSRLDQTLIINRPGVARGVLQSPL